MAQQTEVRYVRFYTDGSTARKLDVMRPAAKTTLPKKRKQKKILLAVDPVAILGTLAAIAMLIIMLVSLFLYVEERNKAEIMEQRVAEMRVENEKLQAEYEAGYDIDTVEKTALALGMVPEEQVTHVKLEVKQPAPEKEPSAWAQFVAMLSGLFA